MEHSTWLGGHFQSLQHATGLAFYLDVLNSSINKQHLDFKAPQSATSRNWSSAWGTFVEFIGKSEC